MESESSEIILECKNISKSFVKKNETVKVLENINLKLKKGETLGLVGESGNGKSTLAKIIAGLTEPTAGEVIFHSDAGKKIQMIFQNPYESFDPKHTLGYSIEEGLKNQKIPRSLRKEKVASALAECSLPEDYAKKYPHEVSGGECQRAAIARSISMEPQILICDEATSSLDAEIQTQIIKLLKKLKNEKSLSIIFISHNPALINDFCDRTITIKEGKVWNGL